MQVEEQQRLSELVETIKDNIRSFHKIGSALKEIRDKRLYREISDTFDDFCINHLSIGRAYAYRQIAAAEVANNLSPNGDIPLNEAQARPLTKLKANEQRLAWKYATDIAKTEGRKMTSLDVSKAVGLFEEKQCGNGNKHKTEQKSEKRLERIEVVSREFKKAYEIFFEAIKNAMNDDWQTTSKDTVVIRLKALIRFLNSHG